MSCYNFCVAYKYNDSEKFRANMFMLSGFGFCSPCGASIFEYLVHGNDIALYRFLLSSILFTLGFFIMVYSYSMMFEKDEQNDGI